MAVGRRFVFAFVTLAAFAPAAVQAGSSWDGAWTGKLNNSEPVSVTISGGKVVGYAIRDGQPFSINYSRVTLSTVSFGDVDNYTVKITKTGNATASGFVHTTMMGDGSAMLTRQQ
jgi:hypothetical protein